MKEIKVFRVETRSTILRRDEREMLGLPSHVQQCSILVTAESMAEALRVLEAVNHKASRSHLAPATGTGVDQLRAAGLFSAAGRVYVGDKMDHHGRRVLRVFGSRAALDVGRWVEDKTKPQGLGFELSATVLRERAARSDAAGEPQRQILPVRWNFEEQTRGMYGPVTKVRVVSEWMPPEHVEAVRRFIGMLPGGMGIEAAAAAEAVEEVPGS